MSASERASLRFTMGRRVWVNHSRRKSKSTGVKNVFRAHSREYKAEQDVIK